MGSPLSRNETIQKAMEENRMSKRLWFYSNYHCNLACTYCLTESSPSVPKRVFQADEMITIAKEAAELGLFSDIPKDYFAQKKAQKMANLQAKHKAQRYAPDWETITNMDDGVVMFPPVSEVTPHVDDFNCQQVGKMK